MRPPTPATSQPAGPPWAGRPEACSPPRPPTSRPEAVATDEDVTLVLAGAGTGKTTVIIGKVAHLVSNEGVPPADILVLAFNRKAAEEIRERLPDDLAGATVSTFHAFGRRVIAEVEASPTLSKLAQDEARLVAVIDDILVALLGDPAQSRAVADSSPATARPSARSSTSARPVSSTTKCAVRSRVRSAATW